MWIVSALSIVGVILNIYKLKSCFVVWCVTNFAWMIYDWRMGATAQSALFAFYFFTSLWGLYQWSRKKESN